MRSCQMLRWPCLHIFNKSIDRSIIVIIYKVCNMPILHLQLGKVFQYDIEGNILAIISTESYVTIPLLIMSLFAMMKGTSLHGVYMCCS